MNGDVQPEQDGSQITSALTNGNGGVDIPGITQAVKLILDPSTDNTTRMNASDWLNGTKLHPDAVETGYALATDPAQSVNVRFHGLAMIEHVLLHAWHELTEYKLAELRQCIIEIGMSMSPNDVAYLRNKVAELWVQLAKRSWALDWFDMDDQLRQIWTNGPTSKEFVLTVLENLSEDVFGREDPGAVLRGRDLSTALVNIFTSSSEHTGDIKIGQITYKIRSNDEGWLSRINVFFAECLQNDLSSQQVKRCLLAVLHTLSSVFSWVMTTSVASSGCLSSVCNSLSTENAEIVMAAVETLLALYGRHRLEDADIDTLVYPICHPTNTAILQHVFSWSTVSIEAIYSPKYAISKKLTEVISQVAEWISHKPPPSTITIDFSPFFRLMVTAAEHESLIVSIPIVHSWAKLLAQSYWRQSQVVTECTGPLLQFACSRTLQYDGLPDDANEPAVAFVHDELELFPERQGFFLNYRRLCCQIIELVTFAHLKEAIQHILEQVDNVLDKAQNEEDKFFDIAKYSKTSVPVLHADAQFTIVESAFRGFSSWRSAHRETMSPEEAQLLETTTSTIRSWSVSLMSRRIFRDPLIKQRMIRTAVEISNRALKNDVEFGVQVLQYITSALIPKPSDTTTYAEAVEDLHLYATSELIRLSIHHADSFIPYYDQLYATFSETMRREDLHEGTRGQLTASLFLITQRAINLDLQLRQNRLWGFLVPILEGWENPQVRTALSSFEKYAEFQCFDQVAPYMASINAANAPVWSDVPLDANGAALRDEMRSRMSLMPLRLTRVMLQVSTDKLSLEGPVYQMTCDLWSRILPALLQGTLEMVDYNHRLHDSSAWPNLPPEMQYIAKKIMQDRYWQSGISDGSMNEFQAKIKSSKDTLEGFASSVRGRIRQNLEIGYSILHTLSRLGDTFFNIPQMPETIAQTMLETCSALSPHHFSVLLNMMTKLIDECSPAHRQRFLPPVLHAFLYQLDRKCDTEWQKLGARMATNRSNDDLSDEMREDSILRNFTYKAVNSISMWVDPQRDAKIGPKKPHNSAGQFIKIDASDPGPPQSIRGVILSHIEILTPLIYFYTHALTYRDTKICAGAIRALRWLVPPFATGPAVSTKTAADVRDFISEPVLKTAITCLTDGHFVDQQRDLANLIATIWIAYGLPTYVPATEIQAAHERQALSHLPRASMLQVTGMTPEKVDAAAAQLAREGGVSGNSRHQRAIILNLLQGIKGVRLSELGKIDNSQQRSKLMEKYLRRESMGMQGVDGVQPVDIEAEGVDLGGVSQMFG